MTVGNLINSILQVNRELEQQMQVMSQLSSQVESLRTEISLNFSGTNVSNNLLQPLDKTNQSLSVALPEVKKAKDALAQLTARLRG